MNDLFREQLLKAGVVSKKQAKAAEHQENVSQRRRRKEKSGAPVETAERTAAHAALEEKRARDRELNLARAAEQKNQALDAQVNDLVKQHALNDWAGPVEYHFSDGGKVKKLRVAPAIQQDLRDGIAGIVAGPAGYAIVPRDIALKIVARVPGRLLLLNEREAAEVPEDDPYAAFPVPDDLMW